MIPRSPISFGNALVRATLLRLRLFIAIDLLILCMVVTSSRVADAKNEAPGPYTVQVTFEGPFSNEPVEMEAAGKKMTAKLNTGPAMPEVSGPMNVYIGGLSAILTIRFPRLKLVKLAEINLLNGKYIYVAADKNSISLEQSAQARSFD